MFNKFCAETCNEVDLSEEKSNSVEKLFNVFKRRLYLKYWEIWRKSEKPDLEDAEKKMLDEGFPPIPDDDSLFSPLSIKCTIKGFFFWKKKNEEDASNSTEQISDNQATNPHEKLDFAKEKKAITQARISITILTL